MLPQLLEGAGMAEGEKFKEGEDYYFDANGLMVMTAKYLLRRGYCCGNACRHCPYPAEQPAKNNE